MADVTMKNETGMFYAKILLFGEYGILCDSMALTVPYYRFAGRLGHFNAEESSGTQSAGKSNRALKNFLDYLERLENNGEMPAALDLEALRKDIRRGLFFRSNIPQGYGVGSSGALCAAVYDRYALNKIDADAGSDRDGLRKLKNIFAVLESLFHGVSSGLDPLNCYIKKPLLINPGHGITTVSLPAKISEEGGFFLIDTGKPGKTGPLVKLFFNRCKDEDFLWRIKNEMIPYTNGCIQALINGDKETFLRQLKLLSGFLFEHFRPMIPDSFADVWRAGLNNDTYYLKLNGSGGGGFLLGFTENYDETNRMLSGFRQKLIPLSFSTSG
jgi:mevalonate kinase